MISGVQFVTMMKLEEHKLDRANRGAASRRGNSSTGEIQETERPPQANDSEGGGLRCDRPQRAMQQRLCKPVHVEEKCSCVAFVLLQSVLVRIVTRIHCSSSQFCDSFASQYHSNLGDRFCCTACDGSSSGMDEHEYSRRPRCPRGCPWRRTTGPVRQPREEAPAPSPRPASICNGDRIKIQRE